MLHNLFSVPQAVSTAQARGQSHTDGILTCSGCSLVSPKVQIPTGSLPESEWKGYALRFTGWIDDCPACEAKKAAGRAL